MAFEDVLNTFDVVNVCHVRHPNLNGLEWIEERKQVQFSFVETAANTIALESVPIFKLTVNSDDAEVFVTLHQPDKRRIGSLNYFDMGVVVLQETNFKGTFIHELVNLSIQIKIYTIMI
jgi:hypothetical protein